MRSIRDRLDRIFADKEVLFRSAGEVRFVRIGRRVQIGAALLVAAVLVAWLCATAAMLYNQASVTADRAAMDAKARAIAAEARKVNFFKRAADDIATDLDRRQNALDDMVKSQFGPDANAATVVGKTDTRAATPKKLSAATPASPVLRLKGIAQRQTQFAQRLATLIDQRSAKAEAAIRSFGLNPKQIANGARIAQGGPFIPWSRSDIAEDEALSALAKSFARLNALEQGLAAIPSGRPTASPMLTSSYGYRRDPFNGQAAFHAGVDFPGSYGQTILAAAAGRGRLCRAEAGLWQCDRDRSWPRHHDPLRPSFRFRRPPGRRRGPGPGHRPHGLHRPVNRHAPAFRGAHERQSYQSRPLSGG